MFRKNEVFQPTHPHGVRQGGHTFLPQADGSNPRTRTGCDIRLVGPLPHFRGSNPRTRTGCDGNTGHLELTNYLFQPTHPHGVRQTSIFSHGALGIRTQMCETTPALPNSGWAHIRNRQPNASLQARPPVCEPRWRVMVASGSQHQSRRTIQSCHQRPFGVISLADSNMLNSSFPVVPKEVVPQAILGGINGSLQSVS